MANWSPERGGTGTEPFNRHGDCLPLIDLSMAAKCRQPCQSITATNGDGRPGQSHRGKRHASLGDNQNFFATPPAGVDGRYLVGVSLSSG